MQMALPSERVGKLARRIERVALAARPDFPDTFIAGRSFEPRDRAKRGARQDGSRDGVQGSHSASCWSRLSTICWTITPSNRDSGVTAPVSEIARGSALRLSSSNLPAKVALRR